MIGSLNTVRDSYDYCRSVARRRARNFYYAFAVLPRDKGDAMCAVYAFMRYCDDIADSAELDGDRGRMLEMWRSSLDSTARGDFSGSPILPAFHDTLRRFAIPVQYFHELIDGASMDLAIDHYDTFEQLYDYCYKVASVVGLVCIHVFGFERAEAKRYAEYCGIGFQLTNILRDLKEDIAQGRVYLPREDLCAYHYTADELRNQVRDDHFSSLMKFEVDRARGFYNAAMPLLRLVHDSGRPGLRVMIDIYSAILDKIERRGYDVFTSEVGLSRPEKIGIAARTLLKSRIYGGFSERCELPS